MTMKIVTGSLILHCFPRSNNSTVRSASFLNRYNTGPGHVARWYCRIVRGNRASDLATSIKSTPSGVTTVYLRRISDIFYEKQLVNVRLNEFGKRLEDSNSNFGSRLEEMSQRLDGAGSNFGKRLDEFATRIVSNERLMFGLLSTMVGLVGLTLKTCGDLFRNLDSKVDKLSQEVKSNSQEVKSISQEVKSISQEVKSNSQEIKSISKELLNLSKEIHALGTKLDQGNSQLGKF
jgi:predicted nuclease with TOPRIM domain